MKTRKSIRITSLTTALLTSALLSFAASLHADDANPAVLDAQHKSYTGTIKRVDEKERTLTVESFFMTRTFTAGDHCRVQLEDKPVAALKDLNPGHRVEVRYLTTDGVNVAARIIQEDSSFTGHITSLEATSKLFKVKSGLSTKAFTLSDGCKIVVREEKGRGFADLKLGHKVTVRYVPTLQQNMAFKIEQGSLGFAGTIEAMDASTGTIKVRQMLAAKTFKMGDDCPIIVDGRAGAKLRDLRLGDKITFHYEDVDGVLVANRIAREGSTPRPDSDQLTRRE